MQLLSSFKIQYFNWKGIKIQTHFDPSNSYCGVCFFFVKHTETKINGPTGQ